MFATADHVSFLLSHISDLPTLKVVVVMDDMDGGEKRALSAFAKDKNIKLMDMAECESSLFCARPSLTRCSGRIWKGELNGGGTP